MLHAESAITAWSREYADKGIPSSFRNEPSGAVLDFAEFLKQRDALRGVAIDLGCGAGRNSLYLASCGLKVHALDYTENALAQLRQARQSLGLTDQIAIECQSVTDPWPVEPASIDVAIDTFCYKHQIATANRAQYRHEFARALRPGAYFLLTLAGIDDGYYGPLLADSPDRTNRVIRDPANGIASVLYTPEHVEEEFAGILRFLRHTNKRKVGLMHGKEYLRSTHVFFAQRV